MTLYIFLLWVEKYGGTFKTHIFFFWKKYVERSTYYLEHSTYYVERSAYYLGRSTYYLERLTYYIYISI